MRFLPEGPNIPDELLEERDNGKVVFLCGAGVSYPAGMPDFLGLARFVVEELGAPQNAPSQDMLSMWKDETIPAGARPSLDQIFNLLQQEYTAGDIDYLIAKRLKTPHGVILSAHKTILRLSRGSNGKPQIVTTNFDLLFEKAAQRRLKTHIAPAMPDLAGMQSFDGIVYLHGRTDYRIKRGEGRQNLVVSSSFWTHLYHRELLHLLRLRWHDLPTGKRRLLERRLADGPAKHAHESEEDHQERRSFTAAATNLGWLAINGCQLSTKTLKTLHALRRACPDWRPEWDEAADESYDGRGGNVRTDSDPTPIVGAPLHQIIPLATQHTRSSFAEFTDHKPFDGFVKQCPRRAVAALTLEARKGSYPVAFWDSTLREWPEQAPFRLVWLFLERLARLPSNVVVELQSTLFRWLDNHFLRLTVQDRTRALRGFDTLLDKLFENGPAATKSGLDELYVAGQRQHRSRRTFEHAINGPVGEATKLLLNLMNAAKPGAALRIPADLKSRLERLIEAPGEGAHHSICIIARRLRLLDYVDPDWTRTTVLPWFNPDNPAAEPAWSGYLVDNQLPAPPLFSLLKPYFLTVFGHASEWNWADHAFLRLHEFLVIGCFKHQDSARYISYDEARHALQRTNDRGRTHSINCLNHDVLDGNRTKWRRFGKPFLKKAWPQEDRFRTEGTSREFAALAKKADDFFPEVVETILPYLVPISGEGLFAYPLARPSNEEGDAPATRFPGATLALLDKLVPENPSQVPYKLDIALELIAEAKPSVRQDGRWRRLNDVVAKR